MLQEDFELRSVNFYVHFISGLEQHRIPAEGTLIPYIAHFVFA